MMNEQRITSSPSVHLWPWWSRPLLSSLPHPTSCPFFCLPPTIRTASLNSKTRILLIYSVLSLLVSLHVAQSQDITYRPTPKSASKSIRDASAKERTNTTVDTGQIYFPRPYNLSVILLQWYPPAVRVQWSYNRAEVKNARLQAFQIIHHPVKSRFRIIQEVPPYVANLTLDRLAPGTEYSVQINAMAEGSIANQSRLVLFVSPDTDSRRSHHKFLNRPIHTFPDEENEGLQVREDEVVIVVLVIAAWIGCLFLFFNKWGKIRMLEPYQPQYKESFHNSIHSIHPKPSRMNTCTSVPPNMISIESRGSLIADREMLLHHSRLTESGQLYQCASGTAYHHPAYRPRLNSVYVANPYHRDSLYPESNMPRKFKSAEDLCNALSDLKSLVVQVNNNIPSTSTSVL